MNKQAEVIVIGGGVIGTSVAYYAAKAGKRVVLLDRGDIAAGTSGAGTVFYNPMRILIGSIALVDDDDTPGITSPDYVALQGKKGVVDSRWFYSWLRSPLGEQCILSLARGAVRERMLFNRLAEGAIELPRYTIQEKASAALAALRPMRQAIESKITDINLLPQKILARAFEM